jgi:hydroxyacylglutathione hydrolase
MARGLSAGDVVKVGRTVELKALDTPGHTMSHVCLLSHTDQPALFCGDTLFNAGAGNCHNGGHPEELYKTFDRQLAKPPQSTLIYPGHDYMENNLRFTLNREPDNERPRDARQARRSRPQSRVHTDARSRRGDQHVLSPDQPDGDREIALSPFPTCLRSLTSARCS